MKILTYRTYLHNFIKEAHSKSANLTEPVSCYKEVISRGLLIAF